MQSSDRRKTVQGLAALLMGSSAGSATAQTPKSRLQIVAFDAAGTLEANGAAWRVPIGVWVYRPQNSSVRKGAIAGLLRRRYDLTVTTAETAALFDRRINLLLADNAWRVAPEVRIGATTVTFPPTGANGHTSFDVPLRFGDIASGVGSRVTLDVRGGQSAVAHLVSPEGVSVISDIDDTVKDTGVLDRRRLWEATFFKPFSAVPGMADLLRAIAGRDGAVHYVSSTPWHLYAPIREWLAADGFPVSSLHLKHIRLKDSTLFDIFKSPEVLKPPIIEGLLQRWPKRRFVLIGDTGEKDPEVYGAVARRFGAQIVRILIRRAPGDTTGTSRFEAAFAGLDRQVWQVFDQPNDVTWRP